MSENRNRFIRPRTVAAGTALGVGLYAVGALVPMPREDVQREAPKLELTVDQARQAVAMQHYDCTITPESATAEPRVYDNLRYYDLKTNHINDAIEKNAPRSKITLKVRAKVTPYAAHALDKYENDGTVTWNTPLASADRVRTSRQTHKPVYGEPVPADTKYVRDGEEVAATVTVYPRADDGFKGPIAIRFGTTAETVNAQTGSVEKSQGIVTCGYIQAEGEGWRVLAADALGTPDLPPETYSETHS